MIQAPLVFSRPSRSEVLVFDAESENIVAHLLGDQEYEVLHVRHENFNIPVLVKSLVRSRFRARLISKYYFEIYAEMVQPSLLITSVDTNLHFYEVAMSIPEAASVVVQNGRRSDFFRGVCDGAYYVDYALVMNSAIGEMYARKFGAQYVAVGSVRNNLFPVSDTDSKQELAFISTWTQRAQAIRDDVQDEPIPWETFHAQDEALLGHLATWARERTFQVKIIGCSIKFAQEEFEYFSKLFEALDCDWEFIVRSEELSSYAHLDSAGVIVSIDSTLASEAIARGLKVVVCNSRASQLGRGDLSLGWPDEIAPEGLFWVDSVSGVARKLDEILGIHPAVWVEMLDELSPSEWLMARDAGNARTIELLSTLIAKRVPRES